MSVFDFLLTTKTNLQNGVYQTAMEQTGFWRFFPTDVITAESEPFV